MYTLNETALLIFNSPKKGLQNEKIISDLAKRYTIKESRARKDVENTLFTFLKQKIVKKI